MFIPSIFFVLLTFLFAFLRGVGIHCNLLKDMAHIYMGVLLMGWLMARRIFRDRASAVVLDFGKLCAVFFWFLIIVEVISAKIYHSPLVLF